MDLSTSHLARLALTTLIAMGMGACNGKTGSADAADSNSTGACRLLSSSEVSAALSKAATGVPELTREKYGITACEWSTERGRFIAQYWKSEHPAVNEEASGLMLGMLDPLKAGAAQNVHYEPLTGVGEKAVAVIEKNDAQRGLLNDMALLVAQRGNTILVLMAPELTQDDRAAALRSLQALGKSAVAKLPL